MFKSNTKKGVKDHSCCGVKAKLEFNQKGISASLPINFCKPIATTEKDKEALVKKLLNESGGILTFESVDCKSGKTHLINLYLFIFIQLLFMML